MNDKWMQVDYLCVMGGAGSTRMMLSAVPEWLTNNPGYMIIRLTDLG